MHSNNDGMDPNWKPTPPNKFIQYMNEKKIEFNRNHRETFNTVHVTNWAEEYVSRLMRVIERQKMGLEQILIDPNPYSSEGEAMQASAISALREADALLNGDSNETT